MSTEGECAGYAGLDTGVLLLRNSDWSRAFVADALEFLTNKEKEVRAHSFWQCNLA